MIRLVVLPKKIRGDMGCMTADQSRGGGLIDEGFAGKKGIRRVRQKRKNRLCRQRGLDLRQSLAGCHRKFSSGKELQAGEAGFIAPVGGKRQDRGQQGAG